VFSEQGFSGDKFYPASYDFGGQDRPSFGCNLTKDSDEEDHTRSMFEEDNRLEQMLDEEPITHVSWNNSISNWKNQITNNFVLLHLLTGFMGYQNPSCISIIKKKNV
jgi:hypothetical protein